MVKLIDELRSTVTAVQTRRRAEVQAELDTRRRAAEVATVQREREIADATENIAELAKKYEPLFRDAATKGNRSVTIVLVTKIDDYALSVPALLNKLEPEAVAIVTALPGYLDSHGFVTKANFLHNYSPEDRGCMADGDPGHSAYTTHSLELTVSW